MPAIDAPVHVAPFRVAESVKHISNVFHAVKLTFANEAGAILAAHGVDAREALRLLCEDRVLNISPAYLRPGFAFGGSCLPKDVRSFVALADQKNLAAPMLKHLMPANTAIIDRTFEAVARHGRQPVALFGLAFKQGTDDLRESPFVLLAEKLLGKGYDLRIYDRFVQVATLMGSNRAYIDREIPHLERLMVVSPEAALSGAKVAIIGHVAPEDRPALLAALARPCGDRPRRAGRPARRIPASPMRACAGESPAAAVRQPAVSVSDGPGRQNPHRQHPARDEGRRVRRDAGVSGAGGSCAAMRADIEAACDRFVPWPERAPSRVRRVVALASRLPVAAATDRSAAGSAVVREALGRAAGCRGGGFPACRCADAGADRRRVGDVHPQRRGRDLRAACRARDAGSGGWSGPIKAARWRGWSRTVWPATTP